MAEVTMKRNIKRLFLSGKIEELPDDLINEYRLMIRIDDIDFDDIVLTPKARAGW